MLSPQFVNAKDLRVQMGALNETGVLEEKLKTVGVKKEVMVDSFLKAVESIPEGSEEEAKLPDSVVEFYNSIVDGKDPSPEEIAAMEAKKKKGPKREGPSNEKLAYDMVKAGKSEDEIAKAFTDWSKLASLKMKSPKHSPIAITNVVRRMLISSKNALASIFVLLRNGSKKRLAGKAKLPLRRKRRNNP
jgi:hypothetical protein